MFSPTDWRMCSACSGVVLTLATRPQALDSRTMDVAVERKRIVAECNKLIDQQLAGLNEHLEKYIRKEQV